MPVITFDDFSGGRDVRPDPALSHAKILRRLQNAYIATGKKIKKRPCAQLVAQLEPGTVGLKAFGGKLNTFYGGGAAVNHANSLFVARRVPHQTTGANPVKIHYCDHFNAQMYVAAEYGDATVRHHYLDAPGTWAANTAYTAGAFRTPTVANGFRYECVSSGTSDAAVEPSWPTTIGNSVADGSTMWTCRSFAITDTNCPHTKQVAKQGQKMYAASGSNARYCATGEPRDWTTADDAGFLPCGLYCSGSNDITALFPFRRSSVAAAFSDSMQVWAVDPNPALNDLSENIDGVGTLFHRAHCAVSRDSFFLAQNGYRSISIQSMTENVQESDVGSPIDDAITPEIAADDDPLGIFYPKLGQMWSINGNKVWVYTFSQSSKIFAWSDYTLPFTVDDATVLNQELYVRTGNLVYRMTKDVFKDGATDIPLVDVLMYHQDGKKPGVLKQFIGADRVGRGTATVSYMFFDEDGVERETVAAEYHANSEPGGLLPVEISATRIAPHYQHQLDEEFELSSTMLHYFDLGAR